MIFSLFSYIWLLIILILISPNRVEVWEAATTLAFIPVIIICSYAAEKGWLDLLFCQGTDNKVTEKTFSLFIYLDTSLLSWINLFIGVALPGWLLISIFQNNSSV